MSSFRATQPRAIRLSHEALVRTEFFQPGETLPLIIKPNIDGLNLAEWVGRNREFIESSLIRHGAVLFRGFNSSSVADFRPS